MTAERVSDAQPHLQHPQVLPQKLALYYTSTPLQLAGAPPEARSCNTTKESQGLASALFYTIFLSHVKKLLDIRRGYIFHGKVDKVLLRNDAEKMCGVFYKLAFSSSSLSKRKESLQNENSAATPFLPEVENITGIYVENQSNFGTNGYNKPGPAVAAAPEMWNIQFIKG